MKKKRTISSDLAALRRQAEELLDSSPQDTYDLSGSPEKMQKMIHELAVHQIELEMQMDELLQTRAELEESLESYADLYDFAPLGYLTLDRDGKILRANLTACTLFGIDRSRLVGDRFGRLVSPEDLPVFNAMLERLFSRKVKAHGEVMLDKDSISPAPLSDPSHSVSPAIKPHPVVRIDAVPGKNSETCRMVISDISMQRHIERENESLHSQLLQARQAAESDSASTLNSEDNGRPDFNHHLLNKVIHARIRFSVLSYLSFVDKAYFVEIKNTVRTTDGNLSVHLRMLEMAGYITCDKEEDVPKPPTVCRITPLGREALWSYKACIGSFLGM
ncbi:MAG: histidine kinase [Prosthecochloris sp.]|nr:histidine kinase [Prosthecochloris sp.]